MKEVVLAAAASISMSAPPIGQDGKQWQEMAPGSHFAPAFGDWNAGAHGKFIRLAPGLRVPFHTHSSDYHAVMVSGRMTNFYENGKKSEVGPGDYWNVPAALPHGHECVSKEPCLMYTHSSSRFDFQPHEGMAGQ